MSTLAAVITDVHELLDPNVVKLVRGDDGHALYFSRAPIPWPRDAFARDRNRMPEGAPWLRHIGIYGYRAGFLRRFAQLPPGLLERVESPEQLHPLDARPPVPVRLSPAQFPPGLAPPEPLAPARRHIR